MKAEKLKDLETARSNQQNHQDEINRNRMDQDVRMNY